MKTGYRGLRQFKKFMLKFIAGAIGWSLAFLILVTFQYIFTLEVGQFLKGAILMYFTITFGDPIYYSLIRKFT